MNLTKWEPRVMRSLRREMEDLFDTFAVREPSFFGNGGEWLPALDEVETPEEVVVKAELPGMEEKDIAVSVSGNNLILKGERKAEEEKKEKHFHRIERTYGSFERVLPLPVAVDPEKISATYSKGVLEVHLPKKPEAKPKMIKIGTK